MRRREYPVGAVLCDMHDGYRNLPDNLAVYNEVRLDTTQGTKIINLLVGGPWYVNKFLTVVGHTPDMARLVAAYSYDGRMMALVELAFIGDPDGTITQHDEAGQGP